MTRSKLESEISQARLEISADTISMSISELTNLYREGVLKIRPEFQRLFRWNDEQKSRLIESVLLGIPLPSLFVSQTGDGKWELVDGLQRVSTLLELQGLLVNPDGSVRPPFVLSRTKFLPSLENHCWRRDADGLELTDAQKLDIRLARLDLKVIKRSSDEKAKFDLFQRLNSFGSILTSQEIRTAIIAGVSSDCLAWLLTLAQRDSFQTCLSLTERLTEEQYDVELVLRFLMLHDRKMTGPSARLGDFSARLDDWSIDLATSYPADTERFAQVFNTTFDFLAEVAGEDVFRKWDASKQSFRGSFLNTSYEVIGLGLGHHIAAGTPYRTDVIDAAKELWASSLLTTRFATGLATQDRFVKTIPLGRNLMSNPPSAISGNGT